MAGAPLPREMTVVEVAGFGPPEVLRPARRPVPAPSAGEVLVAVAAAGVNRPDVLQRLGRYPPPPGASDVPGLEVAGTVVATGAGVERFQVGARVCALLAGGGYGEYAAVPEVQCLPVPRGLGFVQAAAVPETFFTVWTNLFDRGRLAAGEWLLVHGGTSGIGSTAIALARARGAHVLATARGPAKVVACGRLGADVAIDYSSEDFVAAAKAATSGRGVDVVLDIVGASYLARNLEALAVDGRLVQVGLLGGARAELDLGVVMTKRLTLTGSTLRPRSPAEKGAIARALEREVWPLLESGAVRPLVHATFPLERAAEAHRLMESSEHIGKIVLVVVSQADSAASLELPEVSS